ncbi:hypothetical protein ACIPVK_18340 [Paeniglutamicibacter sp. MACA_103]|uniref:hypothetical protein n=1 Tax=Paeniglutamicibacter sp. MACA_103 TaxID=3377337 RepID=UPI00389673B6
MNWKQANFLGMGLSATLTALILAALVSNGAGGLHEFRLINTLLLVVFSFVVLAAAFSALAAKFLGFSQCRNCMLAVALAWAFSVPLSAWINMGGATAEAFELDLGDWGWALLPALLYAVAILVLQLGHRRGAKGAAST